MNKLTITPEQIIEGLPTNMEYPNYYHEGRVISAMQSYSDQQNAELREQNRKNQSRWAKDRVEQDKKHESAMMEACGKIVDLEERVKELEDARKSECIAFANWLSNQVLRGRSIEKLWRDYEMEVLK